MNINKASSTGQANLENPWWPVLVAQRTVPPTTREKKYKTKKHSHKGH